MPQLRIVFFGTPIYAVPSLERLIEHPDIDVVAVVTQPDKRRGRGNQLNPSPVKTVAVEHNLPVWQPKRVKRDAETLEFLRSSDADAFVVIAYGQILSQEILDMPRLGSINAHGSLLPAYRGAAPIQWCLYDGVIETGVTTMLMDAGMDTGDMLLKGVTPVHLLDNALDLAKRLSVLSADLLVDTLFELNEGTVQPELQQNEAATYARLIQKEDYQLDWQNSAIALHNQIRGFFPNCFTTFRGKALKVTATVPLDGTPLPHELENELETAISDWQTSQAQQEQAPPVGTIATILKNEGPVVQTANGGLLLRQVQLAGKRSQSGWDFANGMRLEVGERLVEE